MQGEYDFSKGVRDKHYLSNIEQGQQPIVVKIKSEDGDRYVTRRIIAVQAVITPDRKLTAQVPSDIPLGEHQVVVRIEQPASPLRVKATDEINGEEENIEHSA